MNKNKVLIDVYLDLKALEEQLKSLRMVALLNKDPLLNDLVDTVKVIIATIETDTARKERDYQRQQVRNIAQREELERLTQQAKNSKPWAPSSIPPYASSVTTSSGISKKPFTADELKGIFPSKF